MSSTATPADASSSRSRSRPPTCPDENELVLLADGALADKRRASIDRHLDICAPCTLLVAELAGMAAPVRPVPARYKIIRQLGAGAMGVVWEAEDKHLARRVALKFVRTSDGDQPTTAEARRERRSRLVREARALAQLRHPNVVNVYDVGDSADELFLALELVVGTDARMWRTLASRTTADVLGVWRQVATGLAAVHHAGIVHRDIKPDNVLVADDGRVLLGDFGLATDRFTAASSADGTDVTRLTATGAIVGTPIYMAYEQLVGEPATQKSDQYALCVSIWEALTGARPFTGSTLGAIAVAMQARLQPLPAMQPHIFDALARGLEPDPARRWPSIDALIAALDGARVRTRDGATGDRARDRTRAGGGRDPSGTLGEPASRRPTSIWLALGAAALAAAGTLAVLAWRESSASTDGASSAASTLTTPTAPATPAWTSTSEARRVDAGEATPTEREPTTPPSATLWPSKQPPSLSARPHAATPHATAIGAPSTTEPTTAVPTHSVSTTAATTAPTTAPTTPTPIAARTTAAPSTTEPTTAVPTHSTWQLTLDAAGRKLEFGDARACLALLAAMPSPPPTVLDEQAQLLRATCMMKQGDCAGGRAFYEAAGRANQWNASVLATSVRDADFAYCPLDAGPRSRWVERVRYRLVVAAGMKTSCKPVLAFMTKHGLELADPLEQLMLEATCHANAGDCSGARATWRKLMTMREHEPSRVAERSRVADASFAEAFPTCPR